MPAAGRKAWVGAAVVLAALTALGIQTAVITKTGFLMGDFRAFYCGAKVVSLHADPYLRQPLRDCETAMGPRLFFEKNPGVTIPAPLPGYALAALEPLGVLPFPIAASLWAILLILGCAATIVACARFARVGWEISLGGFALSLAMLSLPFGEVVPVALGAIALSAYYAWRNRPRAAAIFAAVAMIEPHLGLPVCCALAVWMRTTRASLAVAFGALGALSLVVLGPAVNVEYFTSVLPAHALSEVTRDTQLSLTAVLTAIHVSPGTAVRAGTLWYAAMLVIGVLAAGLLAKRTRNAAYLVCVPPAFAVFGGTFIHVTQIAAAIPAALLLAVNGSARRRPLVIAALVLLAVPWVWAISPALIVAPLFPVAYLVWRSSGENVRVALLAAIGATLMILGLSQLAAAAPHAAAHGIGPAIDPRLAEASWSVFTQKSSSNALVAWLLRLPTWIALALLLYALTRESGLLRRINLTPALLLAITCTLLPMAAQFYGDRAAGWLGVDFRAYYCAALAQRTGENPYYAQPLHACESITPAPYYRPPRNVTVPAPYPPYALAFFYPLTFLPFEAAIAVWWMILAGAILLAILALARLAAQPLAVAVAALGLAIGLTAFASGNIMPLGFAAVLGAAYAMHRGRPWLGAAAMGLAMVEPHVALPAALGLFVAFPAARVALSVVAGAVVAISLAAGGVAQNVAYFTTILPAHALAEVSRDNQYSLSTVIAALGVPDAAAALAGSLCYLVMTVLGVFVGVRLARRYETLALAVLVPPAFALLGGTFVHTEVLAAAVPAALILFGVAPSYRAAFFAALILLAVPWLFATSAALFLAPICPVAYLTYVLWRRERTVAMAAALAAVAAILGLFMVAGATPGHSTAATHAYAPIDPRLAEASWRDFVLGNSTNRPAMWLLRLPSWIALIVLIAGAAGLEFQGREEVATVIPR